MSECFVWNEDRRKVKDLREVKVESSKNEVLQNKKLQILYDYEMKRSLRRTGVGRSGTTKQ